MKFSIRKVCLDQFRKDLRIYSCPFGHHICGPCKREIKVRNFSPC